MNYQSVLRTINSTDPDTAYLVVADQNGKQQTIVSDSKHPYFAQYGADPTPPEPSPGKPYHGDIANAYWVNAANLEAGHKLIDDSGNWQTVVSVRVEPKPLNSYNLEVEHDHTFFIRGLGGDAGIWVHNTDCWIRIPNNASVSYVDGQLVRTFVHEGRIVKVTPNPNWNPTSKGPIGYQYIEVTVKDGKLIKVNEGQPNNIRHPTDSMKGDNGQYKTDPQHISSDLHRPNLRASTIKEIENLTGFKKLKNGQYYNEASGEIIKVPHYGHKKGFENRRIIRAAEEAKLTQTQLNNYVNKRPRFFQIEEKVDNLSHKNEKPGIDGWQEIYDDMVNVFLKTGK